MESESQKLWNVDLEVSLFHAMRKHKPVGINRHFQMLIIHEKINNSLTQRISIQDIWQHLSEMYDLQALNDSEILPFPIKEEEFSLPESEYATEMNESFPRCKLASLKAECLAEESVLPSHNQATSEAETQKPKVDSRQIKEEKVEDTKENSVVADKKETSREEKKEVTSTRKAKEEKGKASEIGKGDESQEQRKRTRQSGQHTGAGDSAASSPAPSSASSSKRARRT